MDLVSRQASFKSQILYSTLTLSCVAMNKNTKKFKGTSEQPNPSGMYLPCNFKESWNMSLHSLCLTLQETSPAVRAWEEGNSPRLTRQSLTSPTQGCESGKQTSQGWNQNTTHHGITAEWQHRHKIDLNKLQLCQWRRPLLARIVFSFIGCYYGIWKWWEVFQRSSAFDEMIGNPALSSLKTLFGDMWSWAWV